MGTPIPGQAIFLVLSILELCTQEGSFSSQLLSLFLAVCCGSLDLFWSLVSIAGEAWESGAANCSYTTSSAAVL